jgi:hypothetical protein
MVSPLRYWIFPVWAAVAPDLLNAGGKIHSTHEKNINLYNLGQGQLRYCTSKHDFLENLIRVFFSNTQNLTTL